MPRRSRAQVGGADAPALNFALNPARIFPATEAVDSSDNPYRPGQTDGRVRSGICTQFSHGLWSMRLLRDAELLTLSLGH